MDDGRRVVLKVLKPARSYKIKREIRVLQARAPAGDATRQYLITHVVDTRQPFLFVASASVFVSQAFFSFAEGDLGFVICVCVCVFCLPENMPPVWIFSVCGL